MTASDPGTEPGPEAVAAKEPGVPRRSRWRWLRRPVDDTLQGLETVLQGERPLLRLVLVFVGLLACWWVYVPVHELLHALACLVAGGEVTELEIAAEYGGHLFAAIFPFVVPHSEYAGRLSGFDTFGNDWIYLATDFGPYLLTLFPGVWALHRATRRRSGLAFGAALPVALAPFVSLPGDAYEIGSILATRVPGWSDEAGRSLLRGDDVVLVFARVAEAGGGIDWVGFGLAGVLGLAWALITYAVGGWISDALPRGAEPTPAP